MVTVALLLVQNTVLTVAINTLLLHIPPFCNFGYPLLLSLTLSLLCATVSAPHYLYVGKPLVLYCICCGHDAFQVSAAVFAIYLLA